MSENLELPESRQSRRRNTFIKSELELPQLMKQHSDTKLSKKGTNVYVRFRPDNYKEENEGTQCVDYFPDLKTVVADSHSFKFKRIFPGETNQDQIFMSVGVPLIDPMLEGYNCGLIAYGQTGAGKTYTLFGHGYDRAERVGKANPEQVGLIPRMIQSLFHEIQVSITPTVIYTVYMSFMQIYLEKMYDLINPAKEKLKIYQEANGRGLWVTDATSVPVKSSKEILNQIELGIANRITAATLSNAESSRAHAVLLLTINKNLVNQGTVFSSQVYMVDLCGSERTSKTGAIEERLREAGNINKSLLSLGNVISALVEKKKHIPYRDSKLTRLLQNCFGGTSIASLVLCCSASSINSVETLATLRFGDRANMVKNQPVKNVGDSVSELRRLLTEANGKISAQQRIIRTQIERIIELETVTRELFGICGERKVAALRSRYQIKLSVKMANGFERIGFYPFMNVLLFLNPAEVIEIERVNQLFSKRIRSDYLWRSYLELLRIGKVKIFGLEIEKFAEVNDGYYKFIINATGSANIGDSMNSGRSTSGISLFVNRKA